MRIRKVANEQEMDRLVDEYITLGYREKGDHGVESIRMKKKDYGSLLAHIVIIILTFYTFGVANIIYAVIKNHYSDEVLVKIE